MWQHGLGLGPGSYRISVAWVGVPQKVREMSANYTLPREWSVTLRIVNRQMCGRPSSSFTGHVTRPTANFSVQNRSTVRNSKLPLMFVIVTWNLYRDRQNHCCFLNVLLYENYLKISNKTANINVRGDMVSYTEKTAKIKRWYYWLIDWVRLNVPPTQYRSYGDGWYYWATDWHLAIRCWAIAVVYMYLSLIRCYICVFNAML